MEILKELFQGKNIIEPNVHHLWANQLSPDKGVVFHQEDKTDLKT